MSDPWTRGWLADRRFGGWARLRSVESVAAAPASPGVYAVVHDAAEPIEWVRNCGGWFKGRDPSVTSDRLKANWVCGASTVYIGKAVVLRRRLREFARFGNGAAVGHWGGRLVWNLPRPDDLRVGWRLAESESKALAEEARLIAEFRDFFGKPPFANRPERNGT